MEPSIKSFFSRATIMLLLAMIVPTAEVWADGSWESGDCTVTLSGGTLSVSKTNPSSVSGAMAEYNFSDIPWYNDRSNITSVVIEPGVTTIGKHAFRECNNASFTSVNIPASVTSIGQYAFSYCANLATVNFEAGSQLTTIDKHAFEGTSITSITIPASVTTIGEGAFRSTSITSITIPASVTTIGDDVFNNCANLTSINVDANSNSFVSEDGILFNKAKTTLIKYPQAKSGTSYIIPASVKLVFGNSFKSCTNLTSVTIPSSVTCISNFAFCNSPNLANVYFFSESEPSLSLLPFEECTSLTHIYVPSSKVDYYKNHVYLSEFTNIIYGYDGECSATGSAVVWLYDNGTLTITGLGAMADHFSTYWPWHNDRGNITSVVINDGVTHIGEFAFKDCSITSINIPASVTSIGENAFSGCSILESVTFAANSQLSTISSQAFYGCNNAGFTSITIPASVTSIGEQTFRGCAGLTSFNIPANVTTIGDHAFFDCTNLQASMSMPIMRTTPARTACCSTKQRQLSSNIPKPRAERHTSSHPPLQASMFRLSTDAQP